MTDHLIGLSQIADVLNAAYSLKGKRAIRPRTPRIWWLRTRTGGIDMGMPEPDSILGKRQSPYWKPKRIIEWYGQWKGLP